MMKNLDLKAPQVEGIFFGLIATPVLFFAPTPSGFDLAGWPNFRLYGIFYPGLTGKNTMNYSGPSGGNFAS